MRCEVVAVGTELLLGQIVDTTELQLMISASADENNDGEIDRDEFEQIMNLLDR